ncbi:hypothetical protein EJ110_NYTH45932, partial [Nymphaea thermarum]
IAVACSSAIAVVCSSVAITANDSPPSSSPSKVFLPVILPPPPPLVCRLWCQILNCDEIPGIEKVYARVESEEQRHQIMHIDSSHGSSPSAFVSHASGTGQRPVRCCSLCNKLGHSVDFCWDIHPEKRLVRGRPPSSRRGSSVPDSSQGSSSTVEKSKLSSDQIKELQAYISWLSTTQEETSTSEGAKLAQALVATSDQVRGDSDNHVGGNSVDDQPTTRNNLFSQVYTRKKTNVVEDVDVTNPNPVSSPDDPSPIDEELPIALRKGTRAVKFRHCSSSRSHCSSSHHCSSSRSDCSPDARARRQRPSFARLS